MDKEASDEKLAKAMAHTVALENNQMALHQRIAELTAQLRVAKADLGASVMREAELQTQVNVLVDVVDDLRQRVARVVDELQILCEFVETADLDKDTSRTRDILAAEGATSAQP